MLFRRPPCAALRPYVEGLWAWLDDACQPAAKRQWLLPNGSMQLVFRLSPQQRKAVVLRPGAGRPYPMGRISAVFKADEAETADAYSCRSSC